MQHIIEHIIPRYGNMVTECLVRAILVFTYHCRDILKPFLS